MLPSLVRGTYAPSQREMHHITLNNATERINQWNKFQSMFKMPSLSEARLIITHLLYVFQT